MAEQPAAEVGVLVLRADIARELVRGEEGIQLLHGVVRVRIVLRPSASCSTAAAGKPDMWDARSPSVIARPRSGTSNGARAGTWRPGRSGPLRRARPRRPGAAHVNTLVIEPISKTVSPSKRRAVALCRAAVADDTAPAWFEHAHDDADTLAVRVDALGENPRDFGVRHTLLRAGGLPAGGDGAARTRQARVVPKSASAPTATRCS